MRRDATQNVTNFSLFWKTTSRRTAENTFSLCGLSLKIFHSRERKTMSENKLGGYPVASTYVDVSSFHQSFTCTLTFSLHVMFRVCIIDALFVSLSIVLFIYICTRGERFSKKSRFEPCLSRELRDSILYLSKPRGFRDILELNV